MVGAIVANQIGSNPLALPVSGKGAPTAIHVLIKRPLVKRQ